MFVEEKAVQERYDNHVDDGHIHRFLYTPEEMDLCVAMLYLNFNCRRNVQNKCNDQDLKYVILYGRVLRNIGEKDNDDREDTCQKLKVVVTGAKVFFFVQQIACSLLACKNVKHKVDHKSQKE
jgi:hypothetical protein